MRFQRLFDRVGVVEEPFPFSEDYLTNLSDNSHLFEGVEQLIPELYGKVRMMIITNGFARVQRPRFLRSPIRPYFDDIVISDEVGFTKPDTRIFDVAFARMRQPDKKDVLIVGDSLSSDMTGGERYGIDTCWINPNGKAKPGRAEADL